MAKFMFVFHGGAVAEKNISPAELGAHLALWTAWVGGLLERGQAMDGGHPIKSEGKTVRGKKKAVMDGPFAESKDMVTGNLVVIAPSLDDAVTIAMDCPIYVYDGSVEVRPVLPRGAEA